MRRNPATGNYVAETPWDSAGGGSSAREPRPSYQSKISTTVGNYRGVPDLSFDSIAGSFYTSSNAELTAIHGKLGVAADLSNVASGYCGPYAGYTAGTGWDFCAGAGSNKGVIGK